VVDDDDGDLDDPLDVVLACGELLEGAAQVGEPVGEECVQQLLLDRK
jgi:hypothetical protein